MEPGSEANAIEPSVKKGQFIDANRYFDAAGKCKLLDAKGESCPSIVKSKKSNRSRHLQDTHLMESRDGGAYHSPHYKPLAYCSDT